MSWPFSDFLRAAQSASGEGFAARALCHELDFSGSDLHSFARLLLASRLQENQVKSTGQVQHTRHQTHDHELLTYNFKPYTLSTNADHFFRFHAARGDRVRETRSPGPITSTMEYHVEYMNRTTYATAEPAYLYFMD